MVADEQYDHKFFKKFRSQCGLEAAIHFACNSNWEAVAALFTYHGAETLTHRLAILSCFPETASPIECQSLLPLFKYVIFFSTFNLFALLRTWWRILIFLLIYKAFNKIEEKRDSKCQTLFFCLVDCELFFMHNKIVNKFYFRNFLIHFLTFLNVARTSCIHFSSKFQQIILDQKFNSLY